MTASTAAGPDIRGLVTAQAYATGMRESLISPASRATAFSAELDRHGVAGPAVAAVDRARELTAQASAAWQATTDALDQQTAVREAYAAAPESCSREFLADLGASTGQSGAAERSREIGAALTLGQVGAGLIEIVSMADGAVSRMKEPVRTQLSGLLGEEVPDRPLHKAEFVELLERARARLSEQQH